MEENNYNNKNKSYEEMVKRLGGCPVSPEEKKELTDKVMERVKAIFIERQKEDENMPPSNFRF